MENSHLLCVIGLIFCGVSLSSQANIPSLVRPTGYHQELEVETRLDWVSELNITQITSDNDPDTKLILHFNADQLFSLPGLKDHRLQLQSTRNLSAFGTASETFRSQVTGNWSGPIGVSSAFLFAEETIQRSINFSDYTKRSKVKYSVAFITEINITLAEGAAEQLEFIEQPDLRLPQDGVVGLLPLVNSTGVDYTTCYDTLCSSTTTNSYDVVKYYPFGNVIVLASRQVGQNVVAFRTENEQGNQVYSRISSIKLDYYVMIGQHTC
ncbi:unnamed protein product [Phyllotreta striolata]|uniref:Uncharacterized protein n=1 Tax=Phyllotreta striolata TaxID=444603 RepID=A0A9N9XQT9_PHYSR|nr:unnamed protein product [Phyllotreta striolata]